MVFSLDRGAIEFGLELQKYVQWTLEIVDLDIVDSLVLVDKIVLTNYDCLR